MSEKFGQPGKNEQPYEEWLSESLSTSKINDTELTYSKPKSRTEDFNAEDLLIAESVLELVNENGKQFTDTSLALARFHMFNYVRENKDADEQQVLYELNKIKRFSDLEREYSNEANPLPTMGIELEIPMSRITSKMKEVLTILNVNHEDDPWGPFEINPKYSYSPWVAGKLIQEAWRAGYVRNITTLDREPKPGDLSLHLNFGLPKGLEVSISEMQRITDLLTYAFTSPERIEGRKTNTSLMIKDEDTEVSGKFKPETNVKAETHTLSPRRIEIRPTEFRDKSSFRMLVEAQLIMGLFVSQMKKEQKYEITDTEKILSDLYIKFSDEMNKLFNVYKLKPRQYDKDNKHGEKIVMEEIKAEQLEPFFNDLFVDKCRTLITEYARKTSLIIKDAMKQSSTV